MTDDAENEVQRAPARFFCGHPALSFPKGQDAAKLRKGDSKFIGFTVTGKSPRGMGSPKTARGRHIAAMEKAYLANIGAIIFESGKQAAGKASGKARQALASAIQAEAESLAKEGRTSGIARIIAKRCNCTARRVQQVMNKKKRKEQAGGIRSTI